MGGVLSLKKLREGALACQKDILGTLTFLRKRRYPAMKGPAMKTLFLALTGLLLAVMTGGPSLSLAESQPYTSPEMIKKLHIFRNKVGAVFILPQALGPHPGASYILSRAKELHLTPAQISRIRMIRRHMVTRSIRQFARIDKLRAQFLSLMESRNPPLQKGRALYKHLTRLMAQATFDHLSGHVEVGKVLTNEQWKLLK